jgi:hypothetical protein
MKKVYIENDAVVLEEGITKHYFATFVDVAEVLGDGSYEAADAIAQAVNDKGVYEI